MPAHRDDFPACPACSCALQPEGRRLSCAACGGTLVTAADLEAMMNEMSPDDERPIDRRLLAATGEAPHRRLVAAIDTGRACPRCPTRMTAWTIHGVALGRCSEHGIWFDRGALARALQANGDAYAARQFAERPPSSLGGLLGTTIRAIFAPWLKKRRLAKDIEASSPKPPPDKA